ncbi:MAG TPA: transporter substrate-binding domain-containing protein [Syntrophomonadaceae bacterium]|nr:transporter substrate-binding domain-containing protein [Syntrophomonadaceae bacterium]
MKKIMMITISLLVMTAFLVSGCSSKTSPTSTSSSQAAADIKAITDRGVLNVGVKVDVPKFGFKDPKTGNIDGMEIDLARAIAKKILGDEKKINLQAVTAKTRGPLLDNGELDMDIATFTITDERKLSYNFSDPYFTDGVALMVKKDSGIKSLKDLNGKKIGVAQSATSKKAIEDAAAPDGIKVSFLEFGTYPEIKTALDSGRVDCFSVDGAILNGYLDDSVVILSERYSPQNYGIATKKANVALAALVNETVNDMKKSGELDKLIQKWGIK